MDKNGHDHNEKSEHYQYKWQTLQALDLHWYKNAMEINLLTMHGFASKNTCIAMITTGDGKLRYLNKQLPVLNALHDRQHILALVEKLPEVSPTLISQQALNTVFESVANHQRLVNVPLENCHPPYDFILNTLEDDAGIQGILWSLPCEEQPPATRASPLFDLSPVAQWLLTIDPLTAFLDTLGLTTAEAVEKEADRHPDFLCAIPHLVSVSAINRACAQLLGLTADTASLPPVNELFDAKACLHIAQAVATASRQPVTKGYVARLRSPCVKDRIFRIGISLPEKHNLHQGLLFSLSDLSATRLAETALNTAPEFSGILLNLLSDDWFILDFTTNRVIENADELYRITGVDLCPKVKAPDQLLTRKQWVNLPETKALRKSLSKTSLCVTGGSVATGGNAYRHFELRAACLQRDATGKPLSALVLTRDTTDIQHTLDSLSHREERYRLLANNLSDLIITLNKAFKVDYVSRSCEHLPGYDNRVYQSQEKIFSLLGIRDREKSLKQQLVQAIAREEQPGASCAYLNETIESSALCSEGNVLPLELNINLLRDNDNRIAGLLIVGRDISERLAVEANRQLAMSVFDNSLDAICITDSLGKIIQINPAFVRITGFNSEDVIGLESAILSAGWEEIDFKRDIQPAIAKNTYWEGEILSRRQSGDIFLALVRITEILGVNNTLSGHILSFKDITEAKNSEENIRKLAYYDPLTNLPNRSLFHDRLNQALQRGNRNRFFVAVLFIDLDGFKAINDNLGHAHGDRLLTEVGTRLMSAVRSDDTVARMGGDEFTVILNALPTRDTAENATAQIANKIVHRIADPFIIQGKPIRIGCSIGISLYPDDSTSPEELLKQADTAMYHMKALGKNGYHFYTSDLYERTRQRHLLEADLENALENEEFFLVYRPRFQVSNKTFAGLQVGVRWLHPSRGIIKPNVFMPLVEEKGLGTALGDWLIASSMTSLNILQAQGKTLPTMAIPVLDSHYREGYLVNCVKQNLDKNGISPDNLLLEIPQESLINDRGFAYGVLSDLDAIGLGVSVVDFASSDLPLQYFNRLQAREIHISKQLLRQIDRQQEEWPLVKSLINIADNFGYDIVLDGIERQSQLDQVAAMSLPESNRLYFAQDTHIDPFTTPSSEKNPGLDLHPGLIPRNG